MSAHTSGPWHWTSYGCLQDAKGFDVLRGSYDPLDGAYIEVANPADGPLIKTAPKLLASLREMVAVHGLLPSSEELCRAQVAIAEAEGIL